MTDISPCPMCGSKADIWSTGVLECYGKDWQTITIECKKDKDPYCGMDMSIQADFCQLSNSEKILIEAWNKLNRRLSNKE